MTTGLRATGTDSRRYRRPLGERRRRERRCRNGLVAIERRKGADRRAATTAASEPISIRPNVVQDLPSDRGRAVQKAVADAESTWRNEYGEAVDLQEVKDLLAAIVHAVDDEAPRVDLEPHLQSVLGRHLLEMVRTELIRNWRLDDPETHSACEILATLDTLEALRTAMEPNWTNYFASRLAGPDGLGLVVEVAHDLRSPLTSILFLAETLQRGQSGDVNELQSRQLGLIYSAALGLSEMASNVIELARNGNRLASDEPTPFSIPDVLWSVFDITRPIAAEKGLTIKVVPPASDHRLGQPLALSRVLLNLTTNALNFTDGGFVEIAAREQGSLEVEFSVRDTGPGIALEALDTLCSPFRRKPGGDEYAFSGTGVGLALCRRLVEAMNSELRIESRPDWGTRFYFTVRLEQTLS